MARIGTPRTCVTCRICRISRPRSAPEILQVLFGRAARHSTARPSEFAGFLGHDRPRNSADFCRPRVLSLHPGLLKLHQNPWRTARDVGRRYSRFFCWIILATDGSKCNEGHKFSNRQNPRHHPERIELPLILGSAVKTSQIDWTQASFDTR